MFRKRNVVRLQILMAASVNNAAFWSTVPWILIEVDGHVRGT
jgi:hypothetical protein